jgi:ssDNA-binding Zn-finger/Zn-ribbon topoisomerase 1
MFYIKVENDDMKIKIDITDENVFTVCPVCGEEFQIDISDIGEFDLYGTSIYCKKCSGKGDI